MKLSMITDIHEHVEHMQTALARFAAAVVDQVGDGVAGFAVGSAGSGLVIGPVGDGQREGRAGDQDGGAVEARARRSRCWRSVSVKGWRGSLRLRVMRNSLKTTLRQGILFLNDRATGKADDSLVFHVFREPFPATTCPC